MARPRTPKDLKAVLFGHAAAASGFRVRCAFCPKMLAYTAATVDHEPALALGGTPRQAVLACDECNQRRGRVTNDECNRRRRGKARKPRRKRKEA